jgi:integral membrane protein
MNWLKTSLGRLRLVGIVEGLSYLALLGVAVPLKYIWGIPEATRMLGALHGALFVTYVLLLLQTALELRWRIGRVALALLAALLPLGTFWADRALFRPTATPPAA